MVTSVDRIAVFGISRSGKDYTIDGAVDILTSMGRRYSHLSMIGTVHQLLNGRKLSEMSENDKLALMNKVHQEMDSAAVLCSVIVDEHYCFPGTYGRRIIHTGYTDEKLPFKEFYDEELETPYEIVFDQEELRKYRAVAYLDIDPSVILERFRTSEGCKRNELITLEDVKNWILFERTSLQMLCRMYKVPFKTLRDPAKTSEELAKFIME